MLKIGISTCDDKPLTVENLTLMKKSGISAIEISKADYDDFDFIQAKKNCDIAGIEIWSFHLPFFPFEEIDPSSCDEKVQSDTYKLHTDLIKKATDIGIDKFILHASAEPIEDSEREIRLKNAIEYTSKLADFASEYNAFIAVEDLPRSCIGNCSAEINDFLSANDNVKVCFDTNHLLDEGICDFIENVGEKIISVHVSDFDFVNERHWMPGEGDIDWKALFDKLMNKGYNGVWMYELGLEAPKSINRRALTYSDITANAKEIFEGKNPTPIGKRIDNLPFWA